MWIKTFAGIVHQCARPYRLKDSSLVIDGQNFFYECYDDSKLPSAFGPECDRYAEYLKQYLQMFKDANIKCYFIFKGGTKHLESKIKKDRNDPLSVKYKAHPILAKDVHLEVLKDMEFEYVFSEFEAKTDCIALAEKLSCPVLSMDTEFAFSGVTYIPRSTLKFHDQRNILHCKSFSLNFLLKRFMLNKEKLAIFVLLTDLTYFEESTFTSFLKNRGIQNYPYQIRNTKLLTWLSKASQKAVIQDILKESGQPRELINENLHKARRMITRDITGDLAIDYFFNKKVTDRWFGAGVALNIIPKSYIDVYWINILYVSGIPFPGEMEHPITLSLNIIKYAYDLLTNFQSNGFMFISKHWDSDRQPIPVKNPIKKPTYQANLSVFENGWDDIRSLGLFQHFVAEEIPFDFDKLEKIPADAKLLLIALVYYSHKKEESTNHIAYGIILCYVILVVVKETVDKAVNDNFVSASDCKIATELLRENFKVSDSEYSISDVNLLYSLTQFQHCLQEINNLNRLCGSPFTPTFYSKTMNSTFIFNIVYSIQEMDEPSFVDNILESAPTVLNCVTHIMELYKDLLMC